MPAVSKKQFRFMQMIAHNKKRAKEKGISPETASEFVNKTNSYDNLPEKKKKKG